MRGQRRVPALLATAPHPLLVRMAPGFPACQPAIAQPRALGPPRPRSRSVQRRSVWAAAASRPGKCR